MEPDSPLSRLPGIQSTKNEIINILTYINNVLTGDDVNAIKTILMLHCNACNDDPFGLFQFLLQRSGQNYKALIITLYDAMRRHKPGCITPEWKNAVTKYRRLLGPDVVNFCNIYGRESDLDNLSKLVSPNSEFKVINICGMAGIGKSYLVRHFLWMKAENYTVYRVDCGGRDVNGVINALLLEIETDAYAGEGNPLVSLLGSLSQRLEERILIALDDISMFVLDEDKNGLEEISQCLLRIIDTHKEVKILLTSQETMGRNEENCSPSIYALQSVLTDYQIRELNYEDVLQFLSIDQDVVSSNHALQRLLEMCQGHPYCLSVVKTLLEETAEGLSSMNFIQEYLSVTKETLLQGLIELRFSQLGEKHKLVLEMLSLFPDGTQLRHIYKVLYPQSAGEERSARDSSMLDFCNGACSDFAHNFWIKVTTPQMKSVAVRKANYHVTFYHPSMREFVLNRFKQQSCFQKKMMAFIHYLLHCIVEVTSTSIVEVKRSSVDLLHLRSSIAHALDLLTLSDNCKSSLAIFDGLNSHDLAHLCLFIENYHEMFSSSLNKLSVLLYQRLNENFVFNLSCICLLLLRKEKDYAKMDQLVEVADPHAKLSLRSELMKSLFCYCNGILLRDYSRYTTDLRQQNRALQRFKEARDYMTKITIDDSGCNVQSYKLPWMTLFYYQSAVTRYRIAMLETPLKGDDFKNCLRDIGKAEITNKEIGATTLFTVGLLQQKCIALATQADQMANKDLNAAEKVFENVDHVYAQILEQLRKWRRDFSKYAASTHYALGTFLHSWALLRMEIPFSKEKVDRLLDRAQIQFERGLQLFKVLSNDCLYLVVRSHIRIADINRALLYQRRRDAPVRMYCRKVYEHYYEAYNILRRKHHLCNVAPNDYWLNHLKEHLLQYLNSQKHTYSEEKIRQISVNLEKIVRIADRTDTDDISLSGSELSFYSGLSSDDEEKLASCASEMSITSESPQNPLRHPLKRRREDVNE